MGLLAGFCAVALQAVGSLLISGLLILPALIARLFAIIANDDGILSIIFAQMAVTAGVWGVWFDIQTGLSIVLMLAIGFLLPLPAKILSKYALTSPTTIPLISFNYPIYT